MDNSFRNIFKKKGLIFTITLVMFLVLNISIAEAATRKVALTGNDVGNCQTQACATIKYAISKAGAGDVISLADGTYTEAGIQITKGMTLRGEHSKGTIVQAATAPDIAADRVFLVKAGSQKVVFENMTIRFGKKKLGGGIAIDNSKNVFLRKVIVIQNTASSGTGTGLTDGLGGGIYQWESKLTIDGCIITENFAVSTGGGIYSGCFTTLTVKDSTIKSNKADYHGGGIDIGAPSTLVVEDSTISENLAKFSSGGISSSDKATISNSLIIDNGATNRGGGIRNHGEMTITACTIHSNGSYNGGGIQNGGTIEIKQSTISDNGGCGIKSVGTGGGSANIVNSTITNNGSYNAGGGVCNNNLTTISNCTIVGNKTGGITNLGELTIKNSIVADSKFLVTAPEDCKNYSSGTITAIGVNFDTDGTCPGFKQVTSAHLNLGGLLPNPPGNTTTHELKPGSIAIDTASDCKDINGTKLSEDQRGVSRPQPQNGKCDVGAFERN